MKEISFIIQYKDFKNIYIETLCDDLVYAFKTFRYETTLYFNSLDDQALFRLKYNL